MIDYPPLSGTGWFVSFCPHGAWVFVAGDFVRIVIVVISLCWAQLTLAASPSTPPLTPLTIVASVEPLAMLVREVLGDQVEVKTLLLPGQTPHFTAFTPGQAQRVQQADLIVWLGVDAEPNLAALVNKSRGQRLAMLDVGGLTLRYGVGHAHDSDQTSDDSLNDAVHGAGDHAASELDPHMWLSPENMARLAQALAEQGKALGLDSADTDARLHHFEKTLAQTLAVSRQRLAPYAQQHWLSQHNPWLYFSEALSLRVGMQVSSGLQGGTSTRRFAELIEQMQSKSVHCVVAEPEARRAMMARLCQPDACRIVEADPLGRDLADARYTELLAHLTQQFELCLQ
jgi:zinc transport system substrate-binding protein